MKPRIVFLYGSAGGGHKSVADALIEAVAKSYGGKIEASQVDVLKEYAPKPFDKTPEAYQRMIKSPQFWKQFYELGDGPLRAKLIAQGFSLYGRRAVVNMVSHHPADLYVSLYHFATVPVLEYIERKKLGIPLVTVVTDLVTTPPLWFDKRVDMCIVPTEQAKARALAAGLNQARIKVMGLPVNNKFTALHKSKTDLREKLGWPTDRPMLLLMAGGEGVGPLAKISQALAASGLPIGLALVAGKNRRLKINLEAMHLPVPTYIYGFANNVDDLMHAADIIITKAGPTSIVEAFACGLPMIIYGRLPGQEDGNVEYVTDEGAGVWAPSPEEVVTAVQRWTTHPAQLKAAAKASKSLARPNAGRDIVKLLATMAIDQARLKSLR